MSDIDPGLIAACVVTPFVLLTINILVMAKYLDPSATTGHYMAKLMILLGMLFAECTILLLPLDVANRAGVIGCGFWNDNCGGMNLAIVWEVAYCIIAALVIIVFPFFIFFYENDDEGMEVEADAEAGFFAKLCNCRNVKRSLGVAIGYTLVTLVISLIVILVMYKYLGKTYIPYKIASVDVGGNAFQSVNALIMPTGSTVCPGGGTTSCLLACGVGTCTFKSAVLQMDVTFIIYMAAVLSWVGWFIFAIYVGIGLVALPLDLVNAFAHRPKLLAVSEARQQRRALMNRAQELIKVGEEMGNKLIDFSDEMHSKKERRKRKKADAGEMNKFRVLVDMLEADLEAFQLCDPQNYREHYNPFVPFFKLFFGIIAGILSGLWITHMILYLLFTKAPIHPFLNEYFTWFDTWFPLFGTLSIAVFAMYLLIAAVKGNFKFGTRFFLIKVHPMEPHKTLMNSFVFNLALALLCVLPCTQFCTKAFDQYSRLTDADVVFGSQFEHLEFFRYFWEYNVFLFMIFGFFILALVYFLIWPSDRDHLNKVMQQIKADKAKERKTLEKHVSRAGGALSQVEMVKRK